MTNTIRLVPCPTCGKPSPWTDSNSWKPFCSERCKIIDLGAWANEQYQIPSEESPAQDEERE